MLTRIQRGKMTILDELKAQLVQAKDRLLSIENLHKSIGAPNGSRSVLRKLDKLVDDRGNAILSIRNIENDIKEQSARLEERAATSTIADDRSAGSIATTSSFLNGITEKITGLVKNPLAIGVVVVAAGAIIYSKKSRTSKR